MSSRQEIDLVLGLVRHALTHLERGNLGAVREALEDAERRLTAGDDEERAKETAPAAPEL